MELRHPTARRGWLTRGLTHSRALSTDEAAAIVISELSDRLLGDAELLENGSDDGPDAHTMDDVISRVKAAYAADATSRIEQIEAQRNALIAAAELERDAIEITAREREASISQVAESERARAREIEQRVDHRARSIARATVAAVYWVTALLVLAGGVTLILGHQIHGGWIGKILAGAVVVFLIFELVGILQHLRHLRLRLEDRLANWVRRWLAG